MGPNLPHPCPALEDMRNPVVASVVWLLLLTNLLPQESLYERQDGLRHGGASHVAQLHALGVLNERLSLAHCTWVSEADLALLAATGACISHNPSSNLRLRAGHAPLPAMLAAAAPQTVGLGLDGNGMADDDE